MGRDSGSKVETGIDPPHSELDIKYYLPAFPFQENARQGPTTIQSINKSKSANLWAKEWLMTGSASMTF